MRTLLQNCVQTLPDATPPIGKIHPLQQCIAIFFAIFNHAQLFPDIIKPFTDFSNHFRDFQPLPVIFNNFQKGLLTLASLNGLLGSHKEDTINQNGILTLTCFNGSDKEYMLNQMGIHTLTGLKSLLGSDKQDRQILTVSSF